APRSLERAGESDQTGGKPGEGWPMIANVLVKNAWYAAGLSQEFKPGELVGQVVAEKPLVLWRTAEGRVVVFDDRCCHKRMPLSEGRFIDTDLLECAYHGLCYDTKGQCVRVPSHPDGHIPPPRLPEMADPAWETADVKGAMRVPANSLLLIENLLDITHFYPLHDGNI